MNLSLLYESLGMFYIFNPIHIMQHFVARVHGSLLTLEMWTYQSDLGSKRALKRGQIWPLQLCENPDYAEQEQSKICISVHFYFGSTVSNQNCLERPPWCPRKSSPSRWSFQTGSVCMDSLSLHGFTEMCTCRYSKYTL